MALKFHLCSLLPENQLCAAVERLLLLSLPAGAAAVWDIVLGQGLAAWAGACRVCRVSLLSALPFLTLFSHTKHLYF